MIQNVNLVGRVDMGGTVNLDHSTGSESEDSSLSDVVAAAVTLDADWSGYYTEAQIIAVLRAEGVRFSEVTSQNWVNGIPTNDDQFQQHAYLPVPLADIDDGYFTNELLNYISAIDKNDLTPGNRRFVIPVNIPLREGHHWALLAVQLDDINSDLWDTLTTELNKLDDISADALVNHAEIVTQIKRVYQNVQLRFVDSLDSDHITEATKTRILNSIDNAYPGAKNDPAHRIPFLQTGNNCAKHVIGHALNYLNKGEPYPEPTDIAAWESELEARHKNITAAPVFELEEAEVLDVANSNLFGRWNVVTLENYVNDNPDLFENLQIKRKKDGSIKAIQVDHHYDEDKTVTYTSTATGGLSFPTTNEEVDHKERTKHGILLLLASKGVVNPGEDDAYAYKFTLKTDKPKKQQWFEEVCRELKVTYYSTALVGDASTPEESHEPGPKPELELGDPVPATLAH